MIGIEHKVCRNNSSFIEDSKEIFYTDIHMPFCLANDKRILRKFKEEIL